MNRQVCYIFSVIMLYSNIIANQEAAHKSIYIDKPIKFDIEQAYNKEKLLPIAIIGGGPAGFGAALYAARAKIHTVLFSGPVVGGQLTETSGIENMPGVLPMPGYDLMQVFREQVESFGAVIQEDTITKIDFDKWPFVLHTTDGTSLHALVIILATGSAPRRLGIPGEVKYWGRGVSSCAVCDCVFFKDKDVYVVGGGDSAVEQAMQLAPYVKSVTILVRKERMRAAQRMQDKLEDYKNVIVEYNKEVKKVLGDEKNVTSLEIEDIITKQRTEVPAQGLFLAIGHNPNTELFGDSLRLNKAGYIVCEGRSQATSVPGVFAAGDVEDGEYRQAVIAASSGAKAALDAVKLLRDIGLTDIVAKRLRPLYFLDQE
jgi:thioredoxin reductase (NADPH)